MMDQYQEYIHKSRYARWLPEDGRRESWSETVDRLWNFWAPTVKERAPDYKDYIGELEGVFESVKNMEIMPSMRSMMTAGPALERDNVAGYNCAYLPIDHVRAFDETMYILLCGTGVGFSVERKFINKLPEVPYDIEDTSEVITVSDSKIGWAGAFRKFINCLYNGERPTWDTSRIRS